MATAALAPPPTGAEASDDAIAKLVTRRERVRLWWSGSGAWERKDDPATPIGLALSGGGIRSATFSLGLIQALAKSKRDALARIDLLSTVSGGGYIGCFLRSMFVPTALRGVDRDLVTPDPGLVAEQYRFARRALGSGPQEREVSIPGAGGDDTTFRNPLWWLREHSRYLAPSGPSDYTFALAYLARNWIAMVYLFVLACVALGVVAVGVEGALLAWLRPHWGVAHTVSPLIVLAPILVAIVGAYNIAYWATQGMSTNERSVDKQRGRLRVGVWAILGGAVACLLAVGLIGLVLAVRPDAGGRPVVTRVVDIGGPVLTGVFLGGLVLSVAGALIAAAQGTRLASEKALLTAQLRLLLTNSLAKVGRWLLILLVVVVVDTLGAHLGAMRLGTMPVRGAVLLPALAFLIKKVPDWLGGTGNSGTIGPLLRRFATTIALVVGLLLYGALAVAAMALVHHVTWSATPWAGPAHWSGLLALAAVAWVLAIISGESTGFINLSSLHTLYGSRLTRAYLGASNRERLELKRREPSRTSVSKATTAARSGHPHPITENHPCDYIQPRTYGETDLPAPIHIINVTINETIDPRSQIVARDRKGDVLSLEPGGIRIGAALTDWSRLTNTPPVDGRFHAEGVSLGQWCAISGAAASSGMGRMSSLGYALAFTFANIRLGYWWWAPDLCPEMPRTTGFQGWVAGHFGTFVYLANEMTCRYSCGYDRKYLTDGGHYENSGAFVLIRRRVPLILVSDNGADPGYAFEDLQVLIRQVRIDLGGETTILEGTDLRDYLDTLGATRRDIFVDPAVTRDWQRAMLDSATRPFVLVLRVALGGAQVHLIWVKPRLLPDLPVDVAGYAALSGSFPQQPTGDQFFDEAQWESYRRLGEESMARLLQACPLLLA